ncbi:CD209 antigen-like protein E isoform X1 [Labrus mixtus]|uniref:CD209 antigen-like protein E isoform X1 n=2 Tax=Labrus mixtus TaxID=508554 RepID=UPI0029C09AD0|nr:CD209 antigen-like protein E isoform X1 [Labrus mixtus]
MESNDTTAPLNTFTLKSSNTSRLITFYRSSHDSSSEFSITNANFTERLQDRENELSSLTEQRDLLNANLTEMTKELERLQTLSKQKKTCPTGWKMFRCSCYLFSTHTKTWEGSRQDCRDNGADLVVVDSFEEQEFLTNNIKADTWIGLSDRDNEGTWKWTDDTPLTRGYWRAGQPDNGGGDPRWGEEDCVHFGAGKKKEANWNDLRCDVSKLWICEK